MVRIMRAGMNNKALMINQLAVSSDSQFAQLAPFMWLCFVCLQLFYQGYFHLFFILPLPNFLNNGQLADGPTRRRQLADV